LPRYRPRKPLVWARTADFVPGSDNYINPYPDEKPLFSVDINNYKDHLDHLSEGQIAIIEKYGPDGYRMDVYPTHRDYVPPEWIIENTKKNAVNANMVANGLKIEGNLPGVPFPIPQNGLEVMWNHMIRFSEDHTCESTTWPRRVVRARFSWCMSRVRITPRGVVVRPGSTW
jgi:hypothetical protein